MAYKKKTTVTMDVAGNDAPEETPEVQKTMKIKIVDFQRKMEPGATITLYGIPFTAVKNGNLVAETLTTIAQAGIDAGLYKKV